MRRLLLIALLVALFAQACGDQQLGRRVLECGSTGDGFSSTLVITAEAVPTADYLPCVEALRPGWQFMPVHARSGEAFFTIDSDRMGMGFLKVTLLPSCDVGSAHQTVSDEPSSTLWIEVDEDRIDFEIVIVPVAERHHSYAVSLATLFGGDTVKGRPVVVTIDDSNAPMSEKIARAHSAGHPVVIVDDREVETGTVSLRPVGGDEQPGLGVDTVLERIADRVPGPAYRARWFYTFNGGCIRYDVDAAGEGAQSVARDVARSIGTYSMTDLRRLATEAGYRVFEND